QPSSLTVSLLPFYHPSPPATSTLSLHDALPISTVFTCTVVPSATFCSTSTPAAGEGISASTLSVEISKKGSSRETLSPGFFSHKSEEHTSELQSREKLVCRLLLEKKKENKSKKE